jgi:DNA-binding transcriptional MerR regulator
MRLYSIEEVCSLFSIDTSTLRRWRRRANIVPVIDPSHSARRLYDESQVVALAVAHHRVAVVNDLGIARLESLELRVAELERALLVQLER